jgi:hypothetical protein
MSGRPQMRIEASLTKGTLALGFADKETVRPWPVVRSVPVPVACQNGAETRGIELLPDDEQTGSDQEDGRLTPCVKRPSKQRVAGSNPAGRTHENSRSAHLVVGRSAVLTTRYAPSCPLRADRTVIRGISRLVNDRSRSLLTCALGVERGPADDLLSP